MGRASPGWPGTAHVGNAGIAQRSRATADDDRKTRLEDDDGIHTPAANHLVDDRIHVFANQFATPYG